AGVVQRVNKLVSVVPLRSRYAGNVGDVIIGRVLELGQKRWLVDVCSSKGGILLLSSINLPSGEQRRRTQEDSLNMREIYAEGDLVSAEVHSVMHDGAISLHTRNDKYGKLRHGILVEVKDEPRNPKPEPGTRNPEPETRDPSPEPETLNPKPETRTRNPKP
ncbi:hypothetical protein T484DRAFT_1635032, partial [Baffinella frigidus]